MSETPASLQVPATQDDAQEEGPSSVDSELQVVSPSGPVRGPDRGRNGRFKASRNLPGAISKRATVTGVIVRGEEI